MPRSFRFFLIWLSCTALTVTAVSLTVGFVVGSTAPLPPTARGMSKSYATTTSGPVVIGTPTSAPHSADPSPTARPRRSPAPRTTAPRPPATTRGHAPPSAKCTGGAGTHSFESAGGQATVRFGADAVCLVSAVPGLGFTTSTGKSGSDTLTIVFTGAHHRSELTASLRPQPQEVTREVSW